MITAYNTNNIVNARRVRENKPADKATAEACLKYVERFINENHGYHISMTTYRNSDKKTFALEGQSGDD